MNGRTPPPLPGLPDCAALAACFERAGCAVRQDAAGILRVSACRPATHALVLSVGIHGDETAPVEMVAALMADLARRPGALAPDLLLVVGHPAAIGAGRRFIEADLNRLFRLERGDLAGAAECRRADTIMAAVDAFYRASPAARRWHLDLHTTIRPSLYPTFAMVPDVGAGAERDALLAWLGAAGIEAAVLNRHPAGTFSAWTAREYGAAGATIELGGVAAFSANDLARFSATAAALAALLAGDDGSASASVPALPPPLFEVVRQVVKRSDAFRLAIPAGAPNFSALAPFATIAEDDGCIHAAGDQTEYVLFPNPDVRIGLRAALTAVRRF